MSDHFERFVQQNRSEFDSALPSPRIWEALEQELESNRKGRVVQLLRKNWFKAAVIAVLLVNAAALVYFTGHRQQQQRQEELAALAPDVAEAKVYYSARIDQKLEMINAYPATALGMDSIARQELELKNDTYKALERELKNNPGNERIRAAMIRYYQLKLDLLDKILEELQAKQPAPAQLKKRYEAEI
ncbi:hypothetical protein [Chitinophaga nivalis]|uniref:Anti-sigma factor n=1 Tax=Chitinophaga nivalis TaxID=2991709 RepID=A0ABT3IPX2_9BACT|nr:hypothetical protein [Chitinophaga nivalis]MCW3464331.1 hypothetical protein [Chitinophaga nivalis]MCW3485978.1 hypothetical protein [Chitinophaga nivalis]